MQELGFCMEVMKKMMNSDDEIDSWCRELSVIEVQEFGEGLCNILESIKASFIAYVACRR